MAEFDDDDAKFELVLEPAPKRQNPQPTTIERIVENLVLLVDMPGQTGRVLRGIGRARAYEVARKLRNSADTLPGAGAGTWEFTAGAADDGQYGIWACFTPHDDP